MLAPSPEAPLVPSARGPLPAGPSLRWRRSAEGLRWMRLAMYASLAAWVLWTLLALVGKRAAPPSIATVYPTYAIWLLGYLAFAAGLWRFGSVPGSTGAALPARQSFMCLASRVVLSLLIIPLCMWPPVALTLGKWLIPVSLLLEIALVALGGACLGLLVRALGAALRSLGEKPSAWAPRAVGTHIVLWSLLYVLPFVLAFLPFALPFEFPFGFPMAFLIPLVMGLPRGALNLMWVLALTGESVIVLVLASVMVRTAQVLARQESPETARR